MRSWNDLHISPPLSYCHRYISASKVITMVSGKWEVAGGSKGKKVAQGKKSPKKAGAVKKPEPSAAAATRVVEEDDTFALKSKY